MLWLRHPKPAASARHLGKSTHAQNLHRVRMVRMVRKVRAKRWSHHVMETSDAMDIQRDIFKEGNAQEIADSLKKSSTRSTRRKGTPFQSAMSMLNFYINRAGRNCRSHAALSSITPRNACVRRSDGSRSHSACKVA